MDIVKLLPEQVSKYWDVIRAGILSTPSHIATMNSESIRNILKNILIGNVQCWAAIDEKEEICGFVLTSLADDYVSNERFLNIYDLYLVKPLPREVWTAGIEALKKFAVANKCNKITAYTYYENIANIAKKLGFNTDCRFMIMEV